jgi:hypothetical protein
MKDDLKNNNPEIKKSAVCFLALSLVSFTCAPEIKAQFPGINNSIAKYRKGELIVKAIQGSRVTVEQWR